MQKPLVRTWKLMVLISLISGALSAGRMALRSLSIPSLVYLMDEEEHELAVCHNFVSGGHWVLCCCLWETEAYSNAWFPLTMGEDHLKRKGASNGASSQ